MKPIKSSLFIMIFTSLISSVVYSQFTVSETDPILDKLRMDVRVNGSQYSSDIVGNPYMFKDFHPGKIFLKTGKTYKADLRFDVQSNQINFRENNQLYTLLYPEKIARIEIDTLRFIYCNYVKKAGDETIAGSLYFILKVDGPCKLLIKKNIDLQDAEQPKLYQEAKPAEFINMADDYYMVVGDNPAVSLKNKKDLFIILKDHKDEIENLIDSKKLGIKKIEDVMEIVNFYNSLV